MCSAAARRGTCRGRLPRISQGSDIRYMGMRRESQLSWRRRRMSCYLAVAIHVLLGCTMQ